MTMHEIDAASLSRAQQLEQYGKPRPPRADNQASPKDTSNHQAPPPVADQAEISPAARRLEDLKSAVDAGRAQLAREPEVREDRVALARERLQSGFYQSSVVRERVADGLMRVMFGNDIL